MALLRLLLNFIVLTFYCGSTQARGSTASFLWHRTSRRCSFGLERIPLPSAACGSEGLKIKPVTMARDDLRNLKEPARQREPPSATERRRDLSVHIDDDGGGDDDDESGNVHIPSAGISVSDEMEAAQQDRFATTIVSIDKDSLRPGAKVAQLVTNSLNSDTLEPIRYLVGLSPVPSATTDVSTATNPFVLVDVPPYSPQLAAQIRSYLGSWSGHLIALVITSRDAIHYDSSSNGHVYAIRKSDVSYWKREFPDMAVVSYRLDTPRDCRDSVTQVLDGYGPFALNDTAMASRALNATHKLMLETGRPLTYEEWDFGTAQDVLSGKVVPPDDELSPIGIDQEELYTPQAIRFREEGKSLLAIYTPGHSFGSVSYVFPLIGVCCSGYTLPVEDSRMNNEDNLFGLVRSETTGPVLDCRGYVTTSRAGVARQMESARKLVNDYVDRFDVVLPSRGDPFFLHGPTETRQRELLDMIQQYENIGKIYEELGITSSDEL